MDPAGLSALGAAPRRFIFFTRRRRRQEGTEVIAPETRLRHGDRVLAQRAEDSLVLLDLEGGEYFALDEVSSRIWDLCDGTRDVASVVAALSSEYEAPLETIEEDVQELLKEMVDENLLVVQAP
jgi:coenzyme PQQ biosynthesis protein PqqD